MPDLPSDPDRIAFIQHSAGTTGLQKGVALSHAAVLTQLDHLVDCIQDHRGAIASTAGCPSITTWD